MPADVATGSPWGFVVGYVGGLFGGRGISWREAIERRGPLPIPPGAFDVPNEPPPPVVPTLPDVVVTAPRPSIMRTGSIGRYFDRIKKKFRKLTKEERDMLEFVGEYYANNYMPMPGGMRRGNVKLPRNDARAGRSKQRGFVSPAPTKVVPGSIGYSDTPFKMRTYPKPEAPPKKPRPVPYAIPRQPLPVFRPEELPPLPRETQPQRVPDKQPGRKADTLPKTQAEPGWGGPDVLLPMPQRVPQS